VGIVTRATLDEHKLHHYWEEEVSTYVHIHMYTHRTIGTYIVNVVQYWQ
jgi:hypothetical protein